jgi:predicted ester cyclase
MANSTTETVARRWHQEIYLRGQLDVAEEICSPGFVAHGTGVAPDAPGGPRFLREDAAGMREAFDILAITDEDVIACGDRVVIRWAFRGTHVGPFLGVEGTGRKVHVTGMDIFRFEGDRIAEFWTECNLMDLAEQIGAIPVAVGAWLTTASPRRFLDQGDSSTKATLKGAARHE